MRLDDAPMLTSWPWDAEPTNMAEKTLDLSAGARNGSLADAEATRSRSPDVLAELVDLAGQSATLEVSLRAVRETLAMDVAYVSEIVGRDMVVRELEGDGASFTLARERATPRADTYCQRMLDGRIPNLIPDVRADDRTSSLSITRAGNVGAFATVPLTFADGRVYGTLCAASHEARPLDFRGLQFLKLVARLIADQLEREQATGVVTELASLVDAADEAIIGLTPAGVVTSWNLASERAFGYAADDAIGSGIIDLISLPGGEEEMRLALAAVVGGEIVQREGCRQRADGALIYDVVTLSPIRDRRGTVCSVSAVSRDISAAVLHKHNRALERAVISSLASSTDVDDAVLRLLRGVGEGLDCQIGVLWELDQSGQALSCGALWTRERAADTTFVRTTRDESFARGEHLPGRIWSTGRAEWVTGLDRMAGSPRAQAAAAVGLRTAVGFPLCSGAEAVAVVEFFSANETPKDPELLAMGDMLVGRLADTLARHRAQEELHDANQALEIRVRERTTDLERAMGELVAAQVETVHRLSQAVEFRDKDTGAHIARISASAARTARSAGLDAEQCALIERASPLHDVGKVAIPDEVLLKPGPLTAADRLVIETHAEIGHRLLDGSDSAVLQTAATIALTHHEHYDGGGYPHGLAGEDIPIEGRIVAIADVFDALTSDRVYRPAMTHDQALAIMRQGRGTHFDPELLDHFLSGLDETDTKTKTETPEDSATPGRKTRGRERA
jgi:PAS domain S-box-containing protein